MLNLSIAMIQAFFILALLIQTPAVSITSPQAGATLRGQIQILGSMGGPDFASAELAFSYIIPEGSAANLPDSWFIIQTFPQPVADETLTVWDTTFITDGDYNLRLRVYYLDGSFQEAQITNLKIRNDSPEPTPTPEAEVLPVNPPAPVPTEFPVPPTAIFLQPTVLPSNPASLNAPLVFSTFWRGAAIALVLFLVLSFLLRPRKN